MVKGSFWIRQDYPAALATKIDGWIQGEIGLHKLPKNGYWNAIHISIGCALIVACFKTRKEALEKAQENLTKIQNTIPKHLASRQHTDFLKCIQERRTGVCGASCQERSA